MLPPTGEVLGLQQQQPTEADIPALPPVLSAAAARPMMQCLPLLLNAAGPGASGDVVPIFSSGPIGNSIAKMRELFDAHGFRT